jgi:hypothetical protein
MDKTAMKGVGEFPSQPKKFECSCGGTLFLFLLCGLFYALFLTKSFEQT